MSKVNIFARIFQALGLSRRRPWPIPSPPIPPVIPPEPAPTPGAWTPTDLIRLINIQRANSKIPPLREDAKLNALAQSWATAMARTGTLSHGDFAGRMNAVYPGVLAAENVAEGQPTEDDVIAAWWRSESHRENLLGDFTAIGAGRVVDRSGGVWWVSEFARFIN